MFKIIIIFFTAFLLSGCAVHSPVTVDKGVPVVKKTPAAAEIRNIGAAIVHFTKGVSLTGRQGILGKKYSLKLAAGEFAYAISLNPDFEKAYLNLGLTYFHLGKTEQAIERFEYIIKNFSGPVYYKAMYNLGISYFLLKKHNKALECFKNFKDRNNALEELKKGSVDADFLLNIGSIYMLIEEFELAEAQFTSAIKMAPENRKAYFLLGVLYKQKGKDFLPAARENFKKAIDLQTDYVEAYINLGAVYYSEGDIDNAVKVFKKISGFMKNSPDVYYNLGRAYYEHGEINNAITSFTLSGRHNHSDSRIALAKIFLEQGKPDLALQSIGKMIEMEPQNTDAYFSKGVIYQKTGNHNDAIKAYNHAVKLSGNNVNARNNLAVLYRETGEFDKSIDTYTEILKIDPGFSIAHKNLGIIYDVYLNKLEKAEFHYKEYLNVSGNNNDTVKNWLKEIDKRRDAAP